jgi:hypothetical protein
VTRLIKLIEQNQIERSSQLVEFEKEFKVVCFITLCYIFNYGQTI